MANYELRVRKKFIGLYGSLQEAKEAYKTCDDKIGPALIELYQQPPAEMKGWRLDKEIDDWVETSLPHEE